MVTTSICLVQLDLLLRIYWVPLSHRLKTYSLFVACTHQEQQVERTEAVIGNMHIFKVIVLYTVSQLKWRQNLNPYKCDVTHINIYHFNYIHYNLFNAICNSFLKIYSLVSEIWKFKDHLFMSQVASTENHLSSVFVEVNQMINRTTA